MVAPDTVLLAAEDGAVAELEVPWPPLRHDPPLAGPAQEHRVPPLRAGAATAAPDPAVAALAAHAALPRTALLLLVRRGGFAAGLARDGALLDSSSGTRYVQARTAAGGWSQQRYARRRSGQAANLARAAADAAVTVLRRATNPQVVVVGGDRLLLREVLADPRLSDVAALPRGPLLDVPDPRAAVLRDVARRCRAVRVRVSVRR